VNQKAVGGLRNILVHDYFSIDLDVIWKIVQGIWKTLNLRLSK
jgi:uncharacterized protein with HEPN domain